MEKALSGGSTDQTTNNYGVDKDYVLGRVQTWNVDVNRNLGVAWTVGDNYTHTRGSSLDIVRAPNRDADGLRIPGVQPFTWQSAEGSSILNSSSFRLQRRPVRGIGGQVSYTLAKSRDNAPSIGGGGGAAVVAQNDQDLEGDGGSRTSISVTDSAPASPSSCRSAPVADGWQMAARGPRFSTDGVLRQRSTRIQVRR